MNSYTLRSNLGKEYKLLLQRATAAPNDVVRPLVFSDPVYTEQFIRSLSAPPSLWHRLADTQITPTHSLNRDSDIEQKISYLLISGHISIYELSQSSKSTLPKSKRTIKGANNTLVEFVPAEQLLAEGRTANRRFTDVRDAEKFIESLNASDEQLEQIAQSVGIKKPPISAPASAAGPNPLKDAIAQKLASGDAAAVETVQANRTELEYLDLESEAVQHKPPTLGPENNSEPVQEIKVTAKIDEEYKVALLDKKLSSHQDSAEEKILTDGTEVELWIEQDHGSPVFDQGAKLEISGTGKVEAFLDKEMTSKLDIAKPIPKEQITGGKKLKVWVKGTKAGKFTFKLTPANSSNGKFIIQPPAELEMGVAELKMEIYEQDISNIASIQVDPDKEPISDYHTALDSQALPDQIVLSDEDKIKKGRLLHAQKDDNFGRSKVIIKALTADQFPSGCDSYEFTLNSGGKSGKLKLFDAEFDGAEVTLPLKLKKSDLSADKTYWVEGESESNALLETVLDMGMDRASGGMAKTPKRNGDWGRYSVVKVDTVELDYTQPAGGPNAWDAATKRFFINMQTGAAGRKITIKAKLSKAFKDINVHFMLVEDKNNRTAANWGVDLPNDPTVHEWIWKDITADVKHLDKTDRKDLLHYSAKTDVNGEVTKEVKLSQFGGDKFYLAVYIEQDPHLAKYIDDHATLGKRKPVMATDEVNVWRKFWHQLIEVDGIVNPGVNGAVGQYERVKAEMEAATAITISRPAVNGYNPQAIYPMYMVKVNGGNSDALLVSDTNKGQFFTGYIPEADKPIKIPILICDAQWDTGPNSVAAADQDLASAFPIDITTSHLALNPPLQGGDLFVSGDWTAAESDPVTGSWINVRNGALSNGDITINPARTNLRDVTVNLPAGVGPTNNTTYIWVTNVVIQGAKGPYLGESFNQRILAVYDSSTALQRADFQNTISHEIGHAFQQVAKGNPAGGIAGISRHPKQMDLGQGNHCRHLVDKCVMYDEGPVVGSLNRYCDICHPHLLIQDMTSIV